MFETRSDGGENFIGSLILAGNFTIPEVMVFFHNKLMRGNRTIKYSSSNLDAFHSPNAPDIAKLGTQISGKFQQFRPTICATCFEHVLNIFSQTFAQHFCHNLNRRLYLHKMVIFAPSSTLRFNSTILYIKM